MSNIKTFRVDKGELLELQDFDGEFTNGDCYLIDAGMKIYMWLGSECSVDERFFGSASSVMLDQERGSLPDIDTIEEGDESPEFRSLFKNFRIVEGDQSASILKAPPIETFRTKMFEIAWRTYPTVSIPFGEVETKPLDVSKSHLDSGNCYIVETRDNIFLWTGKGAANIEKFQANILARKLRNNRGNLPKVCRVEEGAETHEFFELFG